MKVLGVIPSRFASTRFPGKPLIDILGKTMIERVYNQVSQSSNLDSLVVATDDQRIYNHVEGFGGKVMMTSNNHQSGTDRCNEVASKMTNFDIIINIQGDEPLIESAQIDKLISCFDNDNCQVATLVSKISDSEILHDRSKVKVVKDKNGRALYFSRQPLPYQKVDENDWCRLHDYWQHIGIYAYRSEALNSIAQLPISSLEKAESLEQLRWLENGIDIYLSETEHESISIDIPEDLARVEAIIRHGEN